MPRPDSLIMPQANAFDGNLTTVIRTSGSVVLIGANGSGKSRLGAWLELKGPQHTQIYRVGAQKSLDFPVRTSPIDLEEAQLRLLYGVDSARYTYENYTTLKNQLKRGINQQETLRKSRWQANPETGQINDYEALLTYLVSDQSAKGVTYLQQSELSSTRLEPPLTKFKLLKRIWEEILPHRQLVIEPSAVKVIPSGPLLTTTAYEARDMSDGERAIFYLIGQCLTESNKSIFVIDEPEVHLNRAIQLRLWNAIEQARPDCLFVYLTHDLDFATSRANAKKVWIKNFNGSAWDWEEITDNEEVPEELLLTVLGSRASVLFTEGEKGKLEHTIFPYIYPDWTVIPRGSGSCEKVIKATQVFRGLPSHHNIDYQGIIDLDYRDEAQVAWLRTQGVHVLDVQEIENLLIVEPVLLQVAICAQVGLMIGDSATVIVNNVKDFVFETFARDIPLIASRKTAWDMEQQLHTIDRKARGIAQLEQVRDQAAQFNVRKVYNDYEQRLTQALDKRDYASVLRLYNNKGLAKQIGRFFGQDSYIELLKRILNSSMNEPLINALREAAPKLIAPPLPIVVPISQISPRTQNSEVTDSIVPEESPSVFNFRATVS